MNPRELLEAFLTPPRLRELSREESFIAQSRTSTVRLKGSGFARGGGDEIKIYRWEEGPAVLFVHGWGSRAAHFEAMILGLREKGVASVAFDAPGHGRSEGTLSSAPAFAAAMEAAAEEHGPFQAVVAHSLGAVATSLALSKALPTQKVALLGSCCWVEPVAIAFARSQGASDVLIEEMLKLAHQEFRSEEISAELSAPALGGVSALLMHDPDDSEMPYRHSVALAAAWPGAILVDTRGVGHRRILRARDIVARTIQHLASDRGATSDDVVRDQSI